MAARHFGDAWLGLGGSEEHPDGLRLAGAGAVRAIADGLWKGRSRGEQRDGGQQAAVLRHLRSPFNAISTNGRRSLPKNIMSPTKLVGAPNTPRATASSVVAFSRSLTSCSWMRLPTLRASRPASVSTFATSAMSLRLLPSTHIAL